ncbi:Rpp14/Pop5 family-domain-containing protein [Cladorrhinum sp. PSN332]|nr:Rpp14/Pop5 family-domain-containing protein [Cladorrhinum sp. PSN332]
MVRLKDRYLLVHIIYTDPPAGQPKTSSIPDILLYNQPTTDALKPQHLLKSIRDEVTTLFGDCGSGAVNRSLQVKYLSPATSTFILRVSRTHYRLVWAALSFMRAVPLRDGRPCVFRVVRVSGTMRKVEAEAIKRSRSLILAAKEEMSGKGSSSASSDALSALLRSDAQQTRSMATQDNSDDDDMSEG